MLLGLCFLGYYRCHSWPYRPNPVHTCFHVYVITFYVCDFVCENKDDNDDDDDTTDPYLFPACVMFVVIFMFVCFNGLP